jgi:hypothetical protein
MCQSNKNVTIKELYALKIKKSLSPEEIGLFVYRRANQEAEHHHWEEALALYQFSLEVFQEVFGPSHYIVARTLNKIGISFFTLGSRYDYDALTAFEHALAIQQKSLGPGDKDIANTLTNIWLMLSKKREEMENEGIIVRCKVHG